MVSNFIRNISFNNQRLYPAHLVMRNILMFFLLTITLSNVLLAQPMLGEIRIFAGNFAPQDWAFCHGQLLPIVDNEALFTLIGTTYGGDGQTTFALPDLRSRVPIGHGQGLGLSNYTTGETGGTETVTLTVGQMPSHTHFIYASAEPGSIENPINASLYAQYPGGVPAFGNTPSVRMLSGVVGSTGGDQPHTNIQPYLAVNYIISLFGIFLGATDPYLGEIRLVSFNTSVNGWAECAGQLLPINQNEALFSLLGTTYGGDGISTFALPDLRGRAPVHAVSTIALGESGGQEQHTLVTSEMPAHTHTLKVPANSAVGTTPDPNNAVTAKSTEGTSLYGTNATTIMNASGLAAVGGNQAHENRQPYLTMRYIIALQGIYPSRN